MENGTLPEASSDDKPRTTAEILEQEAVKAGDITEDETPPAENTENDGPVQETKATEA